MSGFNQMIEFMMKEIGGGEQTHILLVKIYLNAGMDRKALLHRWILSQQYKYTFDDIHEEKSERQEV